MVVVADVVMVVMADVVMTEVVIVAVTVVEVVMRLVACRGVPHTIVTRVRTFNYFSSAQAHAHRSDGKVCAILWQRLNQQQYCGSV